MSHFAIPGRLLDEASVRKLELILSLGNSAYRVRSDRMGLELRVARGVRETVEQAIEETSPTSDAGEHLAAAWNAAYGLDGDPKTAYAEAIKAAESASIPVVQTNQAKATLGTVKGALK